MKHFFDQSTILDETATSELLRSARKELKSKPMNLAEMSTKMDLISFNASASDHYVPQALGSLVTTKNMPLGEKISKDFKEEFAKLVDSNPGDVFGYLLGNIQTKGVYNYLDILFELKHDYRFKPQVATHFSYDELVDYLDEFLKAGVVEGTKRKIELYDERSPIAWKTLTKSSEIKSVDKSVREPVVTERPFFTDIVLKINKNNVEKKLESSVGKLKTVIGYFNKFRTAEGELISSKNKLFLRPKDIHSFKLSSSQAKAMLGISYKGEFISSAQFITHDIGLKPILFKDIDFITFKIDRKPVDIKPNQITKIEINIDTQQVIYSRGVASDEFHVARFNKIRLFKDEDSVFIHKAIPFNRGASNFEQIQTFFASRYTEFEKAQQILTARGELGLLSSRHVCSGDLVTQMALSSMKLLNLLPFETKCIGFTPKDINNPAAAGKLFDDEFKQLQILFKDILDVSQSPDFSDHNINRLSKNMQGFVNLKDSSQLEPEIFDALIVELNELIEYMDNFFKLNVYKSLKDELDCETIPGTDEEVEEISLSGSEEDDTRLDSQTKQFISENFSFFKKRDLVQKSLLKIEKVMFYNNKIKPVTSDPKFEPDLMVYSSAGAREENFALASYPSYSLSSVLEPSVLKNRDEIEELQFVRFMRDFIEKTFSKAQELNKTFHHQYKHTLSELGYIVDEKLFQLNKELEFLEKPENREEAYKQLLGKITDLFHQQLQDKEKNISDLKKEEKKISEKLERYKAEIEKLTGEPVSSDELEQYLLSMPEKLEQRKLEIIAKHKEKLAETTPVFNGYVNFYNGALEYFKKVLEYSSLFQKALWMHRYQKMTEEVLGKVDQYYLFEKEELSQEIETLRSQTASGVVSRKIKKEIDELSRDLEQELYELEKIPSRDLFKNPKSVEDPLKDYLDYYLNESFRLTRLIGILQKIYQRMNVIQNDLFKKQEELVKEELKEKKNEFRLKVLTFIQENPEDKDGVKKLAEQTQNIPKEIKNELGSLRAVLIEALTSFKKAVNKESLTAIISYKAFKLESNKRDRINDIFKELVNYNQGLIAVQNEREGEITDLEYLKSQEDGLEKIAMSKALPSTRVLLKMQYIPMIEKEKALLTRANQFLAEIISKEKQLVEGLTATFFRKRHGFQQFMNGSYCIDTSKGTKDLTEKNIFAAYSFLTERHRKVCSVASSRVEKIGFTKAEILGPEGLKNRISQIWHGKLSDRFLCLPPSISIEEVLDLCEYKDTICQNNKKPQKSRNSIVLVYINKIDFSAIKANPVLLSKYNEAILSNIFVGIDDTNIYNNRDSILEGFVRATFGNCQDQLADQILQVFLQI